MAKTFDQFLDEDEFQQPNERAPSAVLDELRNTLAAKVKYRLEFDVSTSTSVGSRVTNSFRVTLPNVGYTAELFKVSHNVLALYPATIHGIGPGPQSVDVQSEEELVERLGEYLKSNKFSRTIGTLLAQI